MKLNIEVNPRPLANRQFEFGNIDSDYSANSQVFMYKGKPFLPISGEIHFSRMNRCDWRQELLKMRANGMTAIATYVFWNYHEWQNGVFNFEGDNDIKAFLAVCRDIDMPVVLRIGPWCHGEVVHGGFPKYIASMLGTRCDNPRYLTYVSRYFTKLYEQVSDYCDGKTIIGIQLENEYTGSIKHIHTLRKMAINIGFKTPFFTMTAWPTNTPDNKFLPTMGGYPDAPWNHGKSALKPHGRFAISPGRTEAQIGEDMFKTEKAADGLFDEFPYSSCELGPGNQVTNHRRPIIDDKGGYGVGYTRFASGMNWMGYYMYHGGRNSNRHLYQESRITLYPNNYPIIDYDFQAPICRNGYVRTHGDKLRLLHTFINTFDDDIASKQPYFTDKHPKDFYDISVPGMSVRCDENLSGYLFTCAYERGLKYKDFKDVEVTVSAGGKSVNLPKFDIASEAMFFFAFNHEIEGKKFDYVLAQPITKIKRGNKLSVYFTQCEGVAPQLSVDGNIVDLPIDTVGYSYKNGKTEVEIIVLSYERALQFYNINNNAIFSPATLYADNNKLTVLAAADEKIEVNGEIIANAAETEHGKFALSTCGKVRGLPHNYYLYSHGKRHFYKLTLDKTMLKKHYDVLLEFDFVGLNLQVFSGKTLINDYFNTDGKYVMSMRQYADYLNGVDEFVIKAVPKQCIGVANAYFEIEVPNKVVEVKLSKVTPIAAQEIELK